MLHAQTPGLSVAWSRSVQQHYPSHQEARLLQLSVLQLSPEPGSSHTDQDEATTSDQLES